MQLHLVHKQSSSSDIKKINTDYENKCSNKYCNADAPLGKTFFVFSVRYTYNGGAFPEITVISTSIIFTHKMHYEYRSPLVALTQFGKKCQLRPLDMHATICDKLNEYLANFFTARNMVISPTKSTATLFTNYTGDVNRTLNLTVNGVQIPTTKNPKILGVTFDPQFSVNAHTTAIRDKLINRNKVLVTGRQYLGSGQRNLVGHI